MLDLMRENRAKKRGGVSSAKTGRRLQPEDFLVSSQELLRQAKTHLRVLDPEVGEDELVKSVEAELDSIRQKVGDVRLGP